MEDKKKEKNEKEKLVEINLITSSQFKVGTKMYNLKAGKHKVPKQVAIVLGNRGSLV